MKNNILKTLWKEYDNITEKLSVVNPDDNKYNELIKEKENILDKISIAEQNNRKNLIEIGTFVISTLVYCKLVDKSLKFEKNDNVTTIVGRGLVNGIMSKFIKK